MKTSYSVLTKKVEVEMVQHESRSFAGSVRRHHAVELRFDINGYHINVETISLQAARKLMFSLEAILMLKGTPRTHSTKTDDELDRTGEDGARHFEQESDKLEPTNKEERI